MNIYARTPVNKIASRVTRQSGEEDIDYDKSLFERESLVREVQMIELKIQATPKKDPYRKMLGQQKHELLQKLSALPRITPRHFKEFIVDAMKEELSEFMFEKVMSKAKDLASNKKPLDQDD